MDTNTVIEGTVKFRDGKKWKSRWCVVRKLSPVADCLHLQLYRDSKERYKQGQTKASLSLENFLGIQSGFTLDKESNTLAIICQEVTVVLAFDTREHLMQWQVKITANLGEGDQFLVQISSAPSKAKLSPGPARLLIQEFQFCLTVGVPPRLIAFWQIRQLRKYGVVGGKFCFEGGSRCGRGEGLYVLVSEKPEDLTRAFNLAADGKLFTRKRPVTRNMSVMDKVRKHHTLRPESQLSDVSSLDSTITDSHAGCDNTQNCCGCSHSREDLLGDSISNCETHRFDMKNFWGSEVGIGRCTNCMSKLGSMSRSSTLTTTPCSSFPAWTMDRPKSCGSQKMSPSVTCSSISLSSHSSRGSSCGTEEHPQRHSAAAIDTCNGSVCSSSRTLCSGTTAERSLSPPSRPPKPAHLRLPLSPASPPLQQPHHCCCGQLPSPYGNYDVPKPLSFTKPKLNFGARFSPVKSKLDLQTSLSEYYDTPRKLKESLVWEYGNYDIPPPAQPLVTPTTDKTADELASRQVSSDSACVSAGDKKLLSLKLNLNEEPVFHINKVKLTGQGRMPVMSPCGKIIENLEPTYEEKLEILLENESLSSDLETSNSSYANVENIENNNEESVMNNSTNQQQNYSNIGFVQSVENYENFKCLFLDQSKTTREDESKNDVCVKVKEQNESNKDVKSDAFSHNLTNYCSNCGNECTKTDNSCSSLPDSSNNNSSFQHISKNENSSLTDHWCLSCKNRRGLCKTVKDLSHKFLDNKCSSTSCLHEIKHDSLCSNESVEEVSVSSAKEIPSKYFSSVSNSPDLKIVSSNAKDQQSLSSKMHCLSLRKRSNSADSARVPIHLEGESFESNKSKNYHGKTCVLNNSSSVNSLCSVEKLEYNEINHDKTSAHLNIEDFRASPLMISEAGDTSRAIESRQKFSTKYSDLVNARRSSSVPNKFFSNRDSSSSNDSGVSTGSLSFKHYGADFLEFEMPLTTSMSSKRHQIVMVNNVNPEDNEVKHALPKRSKSVDPLKGITFTFDLGEQQNGKSISAEAEVPLYLQESRNKNFLSPHKTSTLPDSRSTSSGTSDMSDYFETLSYSSFSSLDALDNSRFGRASATMKPRSGNEYHKIDRFLLSQETKP